MDKAQFTYVLIGCGRISYKHIEAALKNKDRIRLVGVCDPVGERAQERAGEYREGIRDDDIAFYADYREMLRKKHTETSVRTASTSFSG